MVLPWNIRMRYAELQVTTHFSFLRGASSAEELFVKASELGIQAIGVDRNSLAGIVRALEASRATGLRLVVGCRLDLQDGMSVLVYFGSTEFSPSVPATMTSTTCCRG